MLMFLRVDALGGTEINQLDDVVIDTAEVDVVWLDVTVDDSLAMEVGDRGD